MFGVDEDCGKGRRASVYGEIDSSVARQFFPDVPQTIQQWGQW